MHRSVALGYGRPTGVGPPELSTSLEVVLGRWPGGAGEVPVSRHTSAGGWYDETTACSTMADSRPSRWVGRTVADCRPAPVGRSDRVGAAAGGRGRACARPADRSRVRGGVHGGLAVDRGWMGQLPEVHRKMGAAVPREFTGVQESSISRRCRKTFGDLTSVPCHDRISRPPVLPETGYTAGPGDVRGGAVAGSGVPTLRRVVAGARRSSRE
jgi:hypothetical protein